MFTRHEIGERLFTFAKLESGVFTENERPMSAFKSNYNLKASKGGKVWRAGVSVSGDAAARDEGAVKAIGAGGGRVWKGLGFR